MPELPAWINAMTEFGAKELLTRIIEELDAADESDLLGTEGWRRFFQLDYIVPAVQ